MDYWIIFQGSLTFMIKRWYALSTETLLAIIGEAVGRNVPTPLAAHSSKTAKGDRSVNLVGSGNSIITSSNIISYAPMYAIHNATTP